MHFYDVSMEAGSHPYFKAVRNTTTVMFKVSRTVLPYNYNGKVFPGHMAAILYRKPPSFVLKKYVHNFWQTRSINIILDILNGSQCEIKLFLFVRNVI